MITHVNCVVLYVRDQQRSLDFYLNTLGWEVRTDEVMADGKRWIDVAPPSARTRVALVQAPPDHAFPSEPSAHCTLSTDDVRATFRELDARGAPVTAPVVDSWSAYITITDPDGHTFVISENED
jgi:catechol 2,3-dioxygenase-like lactoylglutathione lyase family enzyme